MQKILACDSGSVAESSILHLPWNGPLWSERKAPSHKNQQNLLLEGFPGKGREGYRNK